MISRALSLTLFPYTTLFRSRGVVALFEHGVSGAAEGTPALLRLAARDGHRAPRRGGRRTAGGQKARERFRRPLHAQDRKSTRLNSSHTVISYAVFCLKKKKD